MKTTYEVKAITTSSCADGNDPKLGEFSSFKAARKCVSEALFNFCVITNLKSGEFVCFWKNRKMRK